MEAGFLSLKLSLEWISQTSRLTCKECPKVTVGNMSLLLERQHVVFFLGRDPSSESRRCCFRANPGHGKPHQPATHLCIPTACLSLAPRTHGEGWPSDLLHLGFQENPSRQTKGTSQTCLLLLRVTQPRSESGVASSPR